jgi:hypothetical protein
MRQLGDGCRMRAAGDCPFRSNESIVGDASSVMYKCQFLTVEGGFGKKEGGCCLLLDALVTLNLSSGHKLQWCSCCRPFMVLYCRLRLSVLSSPVVVSLSSSDD